MTTTSINGDAGSKAVVDPVAGGSPSDGTGSGPEAGAPAGGVTPVRKRWRFVRFVLRVVWKLSSLVVTVGGLGLAGLVAAPAVTDHETLIIKSGSMGTAAPVGSAVVTRPIEPKDVKVGDVILLARERDGRVLTPVLHRVIERWEEDGQIVIRTKGDANPEPDVEPYIMKGTTFTPVVVLPRVGYAVAFLRTPLGWFGLIIGPAVLATIVSIYRLWNTDDDGDDDEPGRGGDPEGIESDPIEGDPTALPVDLTSPVDEPSTPDPGGRHRSRRAGRHLSGQAPSVSASGSGRHAG